MAFFLFVISCFVPEIFKFSYYANLVTDDVIGCASSVVWHKIKNISANNEAMLLKLNRDVAPYKIYQMVHILMLLWQHSSVPVSCLFQGLGIWTEKLIWVQIPRLCPASPPPPPPTSSLTSIGAWQILMEFEQNISSSFHVSLVFTWRFQSSRQPAGKKRRSQVTGHMS